MTLPKWIEESRDWPLQHPTERACGIGCDLPSNVHDSDCKVVKYVKALEIAWEALENISKTTNECTEDDKGNFRISMPFQKAAKRALRRIEEMGK